MRFANRAICAGGLGFAVSCLAACGGGSGNLLTSDQARSLNAQLTRVSSALAAHQCQQAADQIAAFHSAVDGFGSVDQTLISNLDQGASTIAQLAQRECPTKVPTTATATTPTTTTPTVTTATQTVTMPTTQTNTTTTPTTTTTTTPTTTGPTGPSGGVPPGPGNGNGKGNGKGNGNGGSVDGGGG